MQMQSRKGKEKRIILLIPALIAAVLVVAGFMAFLLTGGHRRSTAPQMPLRPPVVRRTTAPKRRTVHRASAREHLPRKAPRVPEAKRSGTAVTLRKAAEKELPAPKVAEVKEKEEGALLLPDAPEQVLHRLLREESRRARPGGTHR